MRKITVVIFIISLLIASGCTSVGKKEEVTAEPTLEIGSLITAEPTKKPTDTSSPDYKKISL